MRILFVGIYSKPVNKPNVPLNEDLCRALLSCGYEIIFLGLGNGIQDINPKLKNKIIRGFQKENNIFKKIVNYMLVTFFSLISLVSESPDLIYVFSTPPFLIALVCLFSRFKGIKIIYDIQDLYPEILTTNMKIHKENLLYRFLESIENWSLNNSSLIRVAGSNMKNVIGKRRGIKPLVNEKIVFVPNWITSDLCKNEGKYIHQEQGSSEGIRELFFEYSGNIGYGQSLEQIVQIAKEMPQHYFFIRGEGTGKARLSDLIKKHKLPNLSLEGFLPFDQYLSHLMNEQFIPLVFLKSGVGLYSIPSKALTLIKFKKRAIYSIDINSELAKIVRKFGIGLVVNPRNIYELQYAISSIDNTKRNEEGFDKLITLLGRDRVLGEYCSYINNVMGLPKS